jgi:hypothetical protein
MDNVIRDMQDLIHDIKGMDRNTFADREDTSRALFNGNEEGIWEKTAKAYEDGLIDAQDALQRARENLILIQERLETLIDTVEYAVLSNKVQGK